jgi:DNA-binding MarR family transcriptional regulator
LEQLLFLFFEFHNHNHFSFYPLILTNMDNSIREINRSLDQLQLSLRSIRYTVARETNLSNSEFDLIAALHSAGRPLNIKELSKELLLCSQAITKLYKRLLNLELISIERTPSDRRQTLLRLTESGARIAEREQQIRLAFLRHSLTHVSDADMASAARIFQILRLQLSNSLKQTTRYNPTPAEFNLPELV